MKRDEQDELLNELLSGEEVSDFRKASLESGLAAIRRGRRQRRAMRMGGISLLAVVAVLGIVAHWRSGRTVQQMVSVKAVAPAVSAPQAETGRVEIITDEQLFADYPGRAMALIGKPGKQRLVFLDGGGAQSRVQ
jgi:hypothetical protein